MNPLERYNEIEKCRKRIKEIELEMDRERQEEMKRLQEIKCESEDEGITADERRCIWCGRGTVIIDDVSSIGEEPKGLVHAYRVFCPKCRANGPARPTKREAVDSWRNANR